jgi:hypothetical protein
MGQYRPQMPVGQVDPYAYQELQNIARSLTEPDAFLTMQVQHAEPRVPSDTRIAMLAIADGTNWNPGSGAGLYRYQNNSWTFIG